MKDPLGIFKKEKRWVNYRLMKMKGKLTKIPYATNGRKASSTNPETWATYKEAKESDEKVGIIFTPAQDLLGIDIDHCLKDKKIEHEQKEKIADLILEADTYTEISPSGEGLHLLLKIDGCLTLSSNKSAPFEAYTSGRYFTVTENCYGEPREVRTVSPEDAEKLLGIIGYPWKEKIEKDIHISPELSTVLDDQTVLTKMFGSKHGNEIKALYNGDISSHKNDASTADMALCSHLAFWTGKNAAQIENMWMRSPLGQREKTQKRKDYRARTIANALAACKEVYESTTMKIEKDNKGTGLDLLFTINDKGNKVFIQNTENMCRILRHHPEFRDRLRYDSFKNIYEKKPKGAHNWRTIEDNDAVNIQTRISILFPSFSRVGKEMVYDAMIKVAKENEIDSAADYIKAIKWDGKRRLESWLSEVYGAPEDAYHKAVGANWLKGLVKRIMEPGCKFDYVLVLEGEQGTRKSTSLSVLGGDWHVETAMSTDSKDFFMQFQGKAIIEFSEGETLSRTEVKRMKAIITMQSDKYRPPYERSSQEFPRRCVFAMTTNMTEYLKDETGNRRWLPVALAKPEADIDWLRANRDQLFAEAYARIQKGETLYEFPKAETLAAQAARRIHDPNADLIANWYFNILTREQRLAGITTHQVYIQAFNNNFGGKPMSRFDEMNIAQVLKENLQLDRVRLMIDSHRSWRWFNPREPQVAETNDEMLESMERQISG